MLRFPRPPVFLPWPCLTALDKMRAALTDALVQKTLHPLKISRKSSAGPVRAGSTSASSAGCGGASPVVLRLQKTAQMASSSSSAQQGGKRKGRKGKAPLSSASGGFGHPSRKRGGEEEEEVLLTGCLVRCVWGVACQLTGGTGRLLGPSLGCCPSCGMGIA